ncbi:MAG: FAD-binding oxidoreductase [Pseudomonadota bacterium]
MSVQLRNGAMPSQGFRSATLATAEPLPYVRAMADDLITTGLCAPDGADLEALAAMTDAAGLVVPADASGRERLAPYLREPRDRLQGRAAALLRPRSTEEVSAMVAHLNARRIALVPVSGGTGLVGGQIFTAAEPAPSPVLLSLERMNRIRDVAPEDGALIAEAGVTLQAVQEAARAVGRLFPLAMASQGSCCIGGNLATNAGGVQVLRYGNARELCLGIEAVMADGSVHHGLKRLRKDNMGYDLRGLLIGAEGTLGIITAAVLKLFQAPGETVTAMLAVPDPSTAVSLLHRLRAILGDGLSAFELMAARGPAFIAEHFPEWRDPLADTPAWRVLLEMTGPAEWGLASRVEGAMAATMEEGIVRDGVVAASEAQRDALWWTRETIPEANRKVGAVASHDVSVPLSAIPRFIEDAAARVARVAPDLRINCFGHVGDGNLHYNLFPPAGGRAADWLEAGRLGSAEVHEAALALGGSFAAEHGIGRVKAAALADRLDATKLVAMRSIKASLDPNGILNPGAVLTNR